MALAGNISIALNDIKLKEIKHHVRKNWLKFYQNKSQKAFANAYRWICIKNKFKVTKGNLTAFFKLYMCISIVKINISNGVGDKITQCVLKYLRFWPHKYV